MIIVTGGAGFIGSAIIWELNKRGRDDILAVDSLGTDNRWMNLRGLRFTDYMEKDAFLHRVQKNMLPDTVSAVIHMGACSDTTEKDAGFLISNNFEYTKALALYSLSKNIRFIYASSAATYGDGLKGYLDDESRLASLAPLNMYGYSKHLFDLWALNQGVLGRMAGLKYFNVFGPNEYHKGDMRSVVIKAFEQIQKSGVVRLFKSYRDDYDDGEQKRDFLYVKDAVQMTLHFLDNPQLGGIFNVGSGRAQTWNDLGGSLFRAMEKPIQIEYIDMPVHLRDRYQYFTKADLKKIRESGWTKEMTSLEDAVADYVQNYLATGSYLETGD